MVAQINTLASPTDHSDLVSSLIWAGKKKNGSLCYLWMAEPCPILLLMGHLKKSL
jgi:hypothetical protein